MPSFREVLHTLKPFATILEVYEAHVLKAKAAQEILYFSLTFPSKFERSSTLLPYDCPIPIAERPRVK